MLTALDEQRLREALTLAERGFGLTDPNPRVGCVIGRSDGQLLGQGSTQRAGEAHAEVMALRDARSSGQTLRGATAWVTLEPCAHHGRTPPCCDALIEAGLARVVVAIGDPHQRVDGQGMARLRAAGIEVVVAAPHSPIAEAAREINIGFFSRMQRGRPWVRMKAAASLDGYTALPDGRSQWITGPEARADGHAWRRRAGAVLTGIGTVLADDPRLDVRLVPTTLQPQRVVLDSRLRLPPASRLLTPPGEVLVLCAQEHPERAQALRARGATIRCVEPTPAGKLSLPAVTRLLGDLGVNELHVEAGSRLNGALLHAGLVDEVLLYLAPTWLGQGRGVAEMAAPRQLNGALRGCFVDSVPLGDDLRLRWRMTAKRATPQPADQELGA